MPIRRLHKWAAVCDKHVMVVECGDSLAIGDTRQDVLDRIGGCLAGVTFRTQEEAIRALCDKCSAEQKRKERGA